MEEQGKLALQTIVSDQGKYDGLAIEAAAEMGSRASTFLATFKAAGEHVQVDASSLARTDGGLLYNPDPTRTSDVAIPNYVDLTQGVLDDIAYSAPMDFIYSALMESFPESLREENLEPIAISFITANSVVRYYPPIGVHTLVPPDVDVTAVAARLGPAANPERRIYWRTPYEDAAGRGLVITAEVPAYDGDTYRGTFQVDLSIDKLVKQLNMLKLTPTGFAFYVDQKGEILKGDAYDLINDEVERGNTAVKAMLEAMRNGQQGVTRATINGNDTFIGYAPIPGVGGSLAMGSSVEELTASAAAITASIGDQGDRTLRTTLLAMSALFIAGLAGATYLNRRVLLKPIEALASGTRAVAQGDLDTSIDLAGDDEIGTLARSFNEMTSEIRESRKDLERRVAERTRELTALLGISSDLASTLDLGPLLSLIIDDVRRVADYSRCSIYTVENDSIVLLDSRSLDLPDVQAPARVPIEVLEPFWASIRAGKPAIIDDVRDDTPQAQAYRRGAGDLIETAFKGVRSWMGVPLSIKDRLIGILMLSHPRARLLHRAARQPRRRDRDAGRRSRSRTRGSTSRPSSSRPSRSASAWRASCTTRSRRRSTASRSARARPARCSTATPRTPPSRSTTCCPWPKPGLAEMRALIFELRPESLETEGLVAALEKQVAAIAARYGIDVDGAARRGAGLPADAEGSLYRIAQEALHNVVKHARATTASRCASRRTTAASCWRCATTAPASTRRSRFPGTWGSSRCRSARAASVRDSRLRARRAPVRPSACRCRRRKLDACLTTSSHWSVTRRMVELKHCSPKPGVRLFAKLEGQNPTGSVKDRIVELHAAMARADGRLAPGQPVVEATTGNTGIALAMAGRRLGHPVRLVVPNDRRSAT